MKNPVKRVAAIHDLSGFVNGGDFHNFQMDDYIRHPKELGLN